jgi:hypothetical protein
MKMRKTAAGLALSLGLASVLGSGCADGPRQGSGPIRVGVAAVAITPCGERPGWDGPITSSGVWGETYEDLNGNGRYDVGEPFTDDPANDVLDPQSAGKYDGIYLAGFGSDRIALGCHDDLWARALVLDDGVRRLAIVSLDLIGTLKYGSYYGFAHAQELLEPELGVTDFVFSSTHDHQGPDALGLWGPDTLVDGKFPRYLAWVDGQTARAIREAVQSMRDVAEIRPARTSPAEDAELRGLQVRTGCRPPFVFDPDLRAVSFVGGDGATIATLVNWGTHPESLEDKNVQVSSDFIHFIREEVERGVGGTAVYVSADLGAVEIVGDTCVDGADPRQPDGSNEFDTRADLGFARTERIGRTVGGAVVRALAVAEPVDVAAMDVKHVSYRFAGSNQTFELGRALGILDLDPVIYDPALCGGSAGLCGPAEQSAISLLDRNGAPQIQIVTFPGEVFPELYLGVAERRRTDCPAADTGRPSEPSVRAALDAPYRLVIGLSPDEIGYVVPGYDFLSAGPLEEAPDPCEGQGFDPDVPRRRVPAHYHESLSVGVDIGSFVTCSLVELLRGPEAVAAEPACAVTR